mgnify:CR=1 FL=1
MVKIGITYEGSFHCRLTHGPSGTEISTDAPEDNMGKGEAFSPTDLTASSLGSCMLTTMAIVAQRKGIELGSASAEVIKEMVSDPERRIGKIHVSIKMPAGLKPDERTILERAAHACPVVKSLNPAIEIPTKFNYTD